MSNGKRIRIIKRAERQEPQAVRAEQGSAVAQDSSAVTQQDAFMIVNGWVRELRRKRAAKAARGFAHLFGEAA